MSNEIIVHIDGHPFATYIDEEGKQRFPQNKIVRTLLETGKLNLNDIWAMASFSMFSFKELASFYMDLGYTVDGFMDVFADFFDEEANGTHTFVNPLWDDETDD